MMPSSLTYGLELDCPSLKCCSAIVEDVCEDDLLTPYLQLNGALWLVLVHVSG